MSATDSMDIHGTILSQINYEDEHLVIGADYDMRLKKMEEEWFLIRLQKDYRAHYDHLVAVHGWENGYSNWCRVETDRLFVGNTDQLKANLYSDCRYEYENRINTF